MKVILDARKIEDYGIGVYLENLFQGIIDSEVHECRIIHLKGTGYLKAPRESFVEATFKNYDFREHFEIPVKISRLKDFYYFSPHYVFPLFLKNRLFVTVHDLIHFKFAHLFKPAVRIEFGKFFMNQVKRRAKFVFAVSNTTKNDLMEIFGFNNDKVKVIYNGISDHFFQKTRYRSCFQFPYILYIGNRKPHKNLMTLLRAFSLLKSQYSDLKLVLVGIKSERDFIQDLKNLNLENCVVLKGYQSKEELIKYIDGAEFFVFPSLYEGFGFPPLEAMARKKAVISSRGGSLKEVLGGSALFFDPESFEDLAEKISIFLENKELRKSYQEKGFLHSLSFRWGETIRKYLAVLKQLE